MRFIEKKLINSQSLASSFSSTIMDFTTLHMLSVEAIATGTPTGTLVISGSNSLNNWNVISTFNLTGSPVVNFYNSGSSFISYKYIKLEYTASSGTGLLDVFVAAKGI